MPQKDWFSKKKALWSNARFHAINHRIHAINPGIHAIKEIFLVRNQEIHAINQGLHLLESGLAPSHAS